MATSTVVHLRQQVIDGEVFVAADDLLVALAAAEMTWEAGGHEVASLRLFARRFQGWMGRCR